jgi:hypothetical protein
MEATRRLFQQTERLMNLNKLIQIAALSLCCGCNGYSYNSDNVVEEVAEEVVRVETGADIDFSPGTPEHGFSPKSIAPISKNDP